MRQRSKILIVDDEPFNVDYLEQELADLDYDTSSAINGREALAQVAAEAPDLILLDIMMPLMDGFEVLAHLKAAPATRDIPVIVISAMNDVQSVVKGILQGAEDYLPKPFDPVLLQARISACLEKKRYRDQEIEYLRQVERLTDAAAAIEQNVFEAEMIAQVAARSDALGNLARVFQRMAHEVYTREQRLKRQIQQLQLDIEERRRAAAETLAIYIPMDRRQALAHGETLPEWTQGAVLMADVSGFTTLTETVAQELGLQRGAEEISRQLDRVYTVLIDEAHHYRGSIIAFSGDAITCWFDEEHGRGTDEAGTSSLRAVACAQAMQTAMRQFATVTTPVGTPITLAIKVAVAAGPARRLLVGDPHLQQVDVLAGRTVDELATIEALARAGEVVVSKACAAQLSEHLIVDEWRNGDQAAVVQRLAIEAAASPWPDLSADALSEAQARPWLLPAVFEKVRTGKADFLSELRSCAALFLHFEGLDYDDDEVSAQLDAFVQWVVRVAGRYAGSLVQLTVGEKGSFLYLTFGAPVAHYDDAARAVSTALELRAPPAALSAITGIHIGLTYGQMRAGTYGSPTRRTYGVMGDKTNLAARLMQAATARRDLADQASDILCDEAIYEAARVQFEFEPLSPIRVKGKAQPIALYRPTGQRAGATPGGISLIGQAAERALIIDRLSPAQQLTLKVASVIGRVFTFDLLRDVYPDEAGRANLSEQLHALTQFNLISAQTLEPLPTYSFQDVLTHETAYNLMLFAQRRQLHRAVAEWHERTYAANLLPYYATLAHHWRQAEDMAKAVYYLEKAGEQARLNGAYQEALAFFNESLALDAQAAVLSQEYYTPEP